MHTEKPPPIMGIQRKHQLAPGHENCSSIQHCITPVVWKSFIFKNEEKNIQLDTLNELEIPPQSGVKPRAVQRCFRFGYYTGYSFVKFPAIRGEKSLVKNQFNLSNLWLKLASSSEPLDH